MGKILDRLKVPFGRRKSALLFEALKRAESQRDAARVAHAAIAEAAETPAEAAETPAEAAETPAGEAETPLAPTPAN